MRNTPSSIEESAPRMGVPAGRESGGPPYSRSGDALLRSSFSHFIGHSPVVDRIDYLLKLAAGKRVIHVGFVDVGLTKVKIDRTTWLHGRLAEVALELVGIDANDQGVRDAQVAGFTAYAADCQRAAEVEALELQPADVVIAGELIEHLSCPGAFLDAMRVLLRNRGLLVLTTPNASALTNFAAALVHHEIVSSDHVAWYSRRTIETLLIRHGWQVSDFAYYAAKRFKPSPDLSIGNRFRAITINTWRVASRPLVSIWPSLADGLIVTATPL
jgi:SAM-dependent methyltransferase